MGLFLIGRRKIWTIAGAVTSGRTVPMRVEALLRRIRNREVRLNYPDIE
jgi:hypothetical protein